VIPLADEVVDIKIIRVYIIRGVSKVGGKRLGRSILDGGDSMDYLVTEKLEELEPQKPESGYAQAKKQIFGS
jgi:hypothetical protein